MSQDTSPSPTKLKPEIGLSCYRCHKSDRTLYPIDIVENRGTVNEIEKRVYLCSPCTIAHDMEVADEERKLIVHERTKRYRSESGVPRIFSDTTMDDFIVPSRYFEPEEIKAIAGVRDLMLKYQETILSGQPQMMVLLGNVGTGKTLLSCIMVNAVINTLNKRAKFIQAGKLVRRLMDNYGYEEIIINLTNNYLTVIDDITSANVSEFTRKSMSDVINALHLEEKSLIITANGTVKALIEKYIGERGYDRIQESETAGGVVKFTWRSFRGVQI